MADRCGTEHGSAKWCSEKEMRSLGIKTGESTKVASIDVAIGDMIKVVTGAWEGNSGEVKSINQSKQTVTIEVDIFGRATSVEIGFADIQKF